jgi:hypothetical protein
MDDSKKAFRKVEGSGLAGCFLRPCEKTIKSSDNSVSVDGAEDKLMA